MPTRQVRKAVRSGKAIGDLGWIRTTDLLLRRQLLYPAELRDHWRQPNIGGQGLKPLFEICRQSVFPMSYRTHMSYRAGVTNSASCVKKPDWGIKAVRNMKTIMQGAL